MSKSKDRRDSDRPYYPLLIIGAGASGIAAGTQLKQKLGFHQFKICDRQSGIGGMFSDGFSLKEAIHTLIRYVVDKPVSWSCKSAPSDK